MCNIAIGSSALYNTQSGCNNIAIGTTALNAQYGGVSNTVAVGAFALTSNSCGTGNVAIGYGAAKCNTSACYNTAMGYSALGTGTIGCYNIGIGPFAGCAIISGSCNTIIGSLVATTNSTGTVYIGAGTSERLRIDNSFAYINGSSSTVFSSLGVGTSTSGMVFGEIRAANNITGYYSSDCRLKENIQDIPNALTKVAAIGGKTFDWTDAYIEEHGGIDDYFMRKNDFGVIAQDVQAVFPEAVHTRPDGYLAVDYERMSALAMAAIKELEKRVHELEQKLSQ